MLINPTLFILESLDSIKSGLSQIQVIDATLKV